MSTSQNEEFMLNEKITLKTIFLSYKYEISFTFFLVILENILYLLFPLFLGFAINGLLNEDLFWLIGLTILGLSEILIASLRRYYDTRLYGKVFEQTTPKLVEKQYENDNTVSEVSARVDMLEELVDFFEDIIPEIIGTLISLFGTLFMLFFLNLDIFTYSLVVLLFVFSIYRFTKKKTIRFHKNLNDIREKQVDVIRTKSTKTTKKFANKLMGCYIKISDLEMVNFGLSFILLIILISTSLYVLINSGVRDYGVIFSVVMYLFNFLEDVIDLPLFYQNYLRLTEIISRLK